jgi:hypothetical protein
MPGPPTATLVELPRMNAVAEPLEVTVLMPGLNEAETIEIRARTEH